MVDGRWVVSRAWVMEYTGASAATVTGEPASASGTLAADLRLLRAAMGAVHDARHRSEPALLGGAAWPSAWLATMVALSEVGNAP
jgi:hypothetical protein